jgi:hypothetical protein
MRYRRLPDFLPRGEGIINRTSSDVVPSRTEKNNASRGFHCEHDKKCFHDVCSLSAFKRNLRHHRLHRRQRERLCDFSGSSKHLRPQYGSAHRGWKRSAAAPKAGGTHLNGPSLPNALFPELNKKLLS